jgi:hypothetical protein
MNMKQVGALLGLAILGWHALSILADAGRCKVNLDRWLAYPSGNTFMKLAVAEGVLIKDLGWFA